MPVASRSHSECELLTFLFWALGEPREHPRLPEEQMRAAIGWAGDPIHATLLQATTPASGSG